ncbi:MAG TPA: choice-of-anchor Q domain-containing protein, partial [Solirubrobacterales bacterium]
GGNIWNDYEHPASSLTIVNSLITGGTASDYGGGVDAFGTSLTLRSTTLSGNHAIAGGGAWVGGEGVAIAIENSTFSGNTTSGFAGALDIELLSGSALVTGTTFSGNQAQQEGGAIGGAVSKGSATVANSTVFGNSSAASGGGGLALNSSEGSILVEASTISGNHATGPEAKGGGVTVSSKNPIQLEDTIVAGNSADTGGADLSGPIDAAFSLVGNPADATLTEAVAGSNLIGADPQLGPLEDNGGPTSTMALAPTSPAVNRGSGSLGVDQRGDPRPVLYPGVPLSAAPGANGADIGAYELQAPPLPSNAFRFGKVKLNKKKGTATVAVIVPGPGAVRLVGSKKVKKAGKTAKAAGTVKILLKAKGKALKALNRKGKVKVKAKFSFTPTGGTIASRTKTLKLVKKRP